MKKKLIYAIAAIVMITGACSRTNNTQDSAESAAAQIQQLEAQRAEAFVTFRDKVTGSMESTMAAAKADPARAQEIYGEFQQRMADEHLQNAEFMQELMSDTTFIKVGEKFQIEMAALGIDTKKLSND